MKIKIYAPMRHPKMQAIGRKLSRLRENIELVYALDGTLYRIKARDGQLIDGASIPWIFWTMLRLTPHGIMDGPALWHDLIYEHKGRMPAGTYQKRIDGEWVDCTEPISRALADALLAELCRWYKIGPRKPLFVWAGVRVGGWWAWLRDDKKRKRKERTYSPWKGEKP